MIHLLQIILARVPNIEKPEEDNSNFILGIILTVLIVGIATYIAPRYFRHLAKLKKAVEAEKRRNAQNDSRMKKKEPKT